MRYALFLLSLFYSAISSSQGIIVDTTTLDIPELVREELMQNACANQSNFKFSSHLGIGKFTSTNPNFPISSGIIIRNGIAKYTEGTYTGLNGSSKLNTATDSDLQIISDNNGQVVPITDVSFIQFDFTPLSSNFSFDFLFASNEYGEFQCGFSDVFAFILTDLTTGISTNLAVVPGTTTPVSVKNIRDQQYNSSCLSANANLFDRYNVTNPGSSAINMRGETKVLTASSTVIPNRTYSIKLAIGDYNDSNYDSAVFIKGGSFMTGMDLGPDRIICEGENIILQSGLVGNYTYVWTLNGTVIAGETSSTLTLNKAGTYGVTATLSGCVIKDEVVIKDLVIAAPKNLTACYSGNPTYQYDLTQNNLAALKLNPAEYTLFYYNSSEAANANGPAIPVNELTLYTSAGNETIYIKAVHISNNNTYCNNLLPFNLLVTEPISVVKPPDLSVCDNISKKVSVDLTVQETTILNGLNPSEYKIRYYTSQADANNAKNNIPNPKAFITSLSQSPQTIWVRIENILNSICYTTINFNINIYSLPAVDDIPDVVACNSYTLQPLTAGNYYTGPKGTGTKLNAGDVITKSGVYYIYSGPNANNCTNESNFNVVLVYEIVFKKEACGKYIVPRVPAGGFYTQAGGRGDAIPAETAFTTSQTIYYYAIINGLVCRDISVPFIVHPLPLVDKPGNVVTCDSYTLPPLVNGNYFTSSGGLGKALNAGDKITSSQTVFVFANDGRCTNEYSFKIDIVKSSIFVPIAKCGNFILPPVPVGGYYDSPGGQGQNIPAGTSITTSQTVYYYAVTTTSPNCTDNLKYQITIKPLPLVDTPANRLECERYVLPPLVNGKYFTKTNGGGSPLKAGDIITTTQTIYVYAVGTECTNEHSFIVEIRKRPQVDSFTDVVTCTAFKLPILKNGKYYTATGGPLGSGTQIAEGTLINTTQTIYIYNEWTDFTKCSNETFFKVNYNGIDVGTFVDINVCDSYTLPPLQLGNYYAQPGGKGPVIQAGTVLTASQRIYVYAITGNRLTCSSEKNFLVNISVTPVLMNTPDVTICGGYTLPPLSLGNYYSGANATGTRYLAGQQITASQQMYIYAVAATNPNCASQDDFNITIYPLKNLVLKNEIICVDFQTGTTMRSAQLSSGLNPAIYTVDWYLDGNKLSTGPDYTATKEGTYTAQITKKTPDVGNDCGYNPATVTVEKSSPAVATVNMTDSFEDTIDVIVTLTNGYGSYEYQLDDGSFQTGNVFSNVDSGEHAITIRDTKANCDDQILIINVLKYPKFFTPNNDGYNDTWNIPDLAFQPDAVINIFDRYGKILKKISPAGPGWDGNYNGDPLPSTDYWFQVFYTQNGTAQVFKSHFSMKR
ncbi:T9SS type B sorting domain-containing protein [Flavobacterium sp. CF136]|uniref:T9SS type B sorting domain-containing protein n=1 Tax=Flavobacterium sp. (strain CF136) TaxID=1144313 RepID=UPI0002715AE9|nr:choice-of-anchor L domain-containing protein [Flavobacterium sp. CF136]EJL64321.1 gliding motility-associated C-terminal domain-containing protein [Flavobacterium sp. CF136]